MRLDQTIRLDENPLILVAGGQRSGKTHFIREMIKEYGWKYDQILVLTGTMFNREIVEGIDHPRIRLLGFSHINPDTRKVENRGEELLQAIIGYHDEMAQNGVPFRTLLVLDDWIGSIKADCPEMIMLARASRHLKITFVLSVQKIKSCVSTAIRGNAQATILFNTLSKAELEGIADVVNEPYYSQNPSSLVNDIRQILDEDYSFCLILKRDRKVLFCAPLKDECRLAIKSKQSFRGRLSTQMQGL